MKRSELDTFPVFYINGSQTLPPPLNSEEEEKLLERLKSNDFEAKQILVERNLRLVVYIAKKFENTGMDLEDLISIGTIGLMKGVNTFNTEKNKADITNGFNYIEEKTKEMERVNVFKLANDTNTFFKRIVLNNGAKEEI